MGVDKDQSKSPGWLRIILVGRNPRTTLVRIVVLVAIVFLGRAYVLAPIKVVGPSMMPTYQERGINFINRLAYLRTDPQRGDVVAIRFSGEDIMLMKRIIALPGETILIRNGQVFINGEPLDEPYLDRENYPSDWDRPSRTLGPNEYYVTGDNRSMPRRFHQEGVTTRDRIVGKVLLCKNWFAFSSSRR
jgi:signal peptidase I